MLVMVTFMSKRRHVGTEFHSPILIQKEAKFIHRWPCSTSSSPTPYLATALVSSFRRLCCNGWWHSLWRCLRWISRVLLCKSQYLFLILLVIFPCRNIHPKNRTNAEYFIFDVHTSTLLQIYVFFNVNCNRLRNVRIEQVWPVWPLLFNSLETLIYNMCIPPTPPQNLF